MRGTTQSEYRAVRERARERAERESERVREKEREREKGTSPSASNRKEVYELPYNLHTLTRPVTPKGQHFIEVSPFHKEQNKHFTVLLSLFILYVRTVWMNSTLAESACTARHVKRVHVQLASPRSSMASKG